MDRIGILLKFKLNYVGKITCNKIQKYLIYYKLYYYAWSRDGQVCLFQRTPVNNIDANRMK